MNTMNAIYNPNCDYLQNKRGIINNYFMVKEIGKVILWHYSSSKNERLKNVYML